LQRATTGLKPTASRFERTVCSDGILPFWLTGHPQDGGRAGAKRVMR
jgi:hypothetical protein